MKVLMALLAALGAAVGAVFGIVMHERGDGSSVSGWTFYQPEMPRRYADYLPSGRPAWFPGLVEYIGLGLVTGLIVGAVLAGLGFRVSRRRQLAHAG